MLQDDGADAGVGVGEQEHGLLVLPQTLQPGAYSGTARTDEGTDVVLQARHNLV